MKPVINSPKVHDALQDDSLYHHRRGDIDYFMGGRMESVYQVDDQYFEFFEGKVSELQVERNQGIITSVFWALMGSRCKTRRR